MRADDIETAESKVQEAYQAAQVLRNEVGDYVETQTAADVASTSASATTTTSVSDDSTESNSSDL